MAFCVFCCIFSRVLQHLALRFGAKRDVFCCILRCVLLQNAFQYLVLPYKPNISLIHSILYNKLFAYIYKFLYLYIIILADIYA